MFWVGLDSSFDVSKICERRYSTHRKCLWGLRDQTWLLGNKVNKEKPQLILKRSETPTRSGTTGIFHQAYSNIQHKPFYGQARFSHQNGKVGNILYSMCSFFNVGNFAFYFNFLKLEEFDAPQIHGPRQVNAKALNWANIMLTPLNSYLEIIPGVSDRNWGESRSIWSVSHFIVQRLAVQATLENLRGGGKGL